MSLTLQRFEKYLWCSGIKKESLSSTERVIEDLDSPSDDSFSIPEDPDLFYQENALAFGAEGSRTIHDTEAKFDRGFVYRNHPLEALPAESRSTYDGGILPVSPIDFFEHWQSHTAEETSRAHSHRQLSQSTQCHPEKLEWAVSPQPADRFDDALSCAYVGHNTLKVENGHRYKNNLCAVGGNHLILAVRSCILVFPFDVFGQPCSLPSMKFDTRPSLTTQQDVDSATRPYFPHTINYINIGVLNAKESLAVCCDDGRVLLFYLNSILENNTTPEHILRVNSSAWGVDFCDKYSLVTVSDNSQCITLFRLLNGIHRITSHQLLHNVPDVAFIDTQGESEIVVHISAVSISGELILFETTLTGTTFTPFVVIARSVLGEDVWTARLVEPEWFKEVISFDALTGAPFPADLADQLLLKSGTLDGESDPCFSNDLGIASKFETFTVPVIKHGSTFRNGLPLREFNDQTRRIRKAYVEYCNRREKKHTSVNGKRYWESIATLCGKKIIVTTNSKMGLFGTDKLLENAVTDGKIFCPLILHEEINFSNRISMIQVIPELQAVIVVSQIGMASLMRLTKHRGCFAFRQEYCFPNISRLLLSESGYRTISGISAKKASSGQDYPVYLIYLVYTDGLVLTYKLSLSLCDELDFF